MQSLKNHGKRQSLARKTALVTGGSREIGAAAALRLGDDGVRGAGGFVTTGTARKSEDVRASMSVLRAQT